MSVALGGAGARPSKDGLSTTAFPSGVGAIPIEVTEVQAPLVFWHKEYLSDSGGAGHWRGGLAQRIQPAYATQSGPMLVIDGKLHPRIREDGTSRKIRNGVGACEEGRTAFAISNEPVTFHEFALLFKIELKCPDALYLDGSISAAYAPSLGRHDRWRPMGPIVGMVAKGK
jgi:uncharacterized protein YigE (DUF2233 family)